MNDLQPVSHQEVQGLMQVINANLDSATANYLTQELTLTERFITKRGIAKILDSIQTRRLEQVANLIENFQEIINEGILERARSERDKYLALLKERNAGQFMQFAEQEYGNLEISLTKRSREDRQRRMEEYLDLENYKNTPEYYDYKEEIEMKQKNSKDLRMTLLNTFKQRIELKAESLRM
jgi:hypothetical protein